MSPSKCSEVKKLQQKVEKLEKDMVELKKWVYKEKKKMNLVDWLNEHYTPIVDFSEWRDKIVVGSEELELIFRHKIEKGLYYIIEQNLPLENRRHFPIIAFNHQRTCLFYIYEKNCWRKIKKSEFSALIEAIHIKVFSAFRTWQKDYKDVIDEVQLKIYNKHLKSILILKEQKEGIRHRLRKRLYKFLVLDIKNIVEYDFTF